MPLHHFNVVKGKIWYECKHCHSYRRRSPNQFVNFSKVEFAITELVRRVGKSEASRRIGISKVHMAAYMNHPPGYVYKETAARIFAALQQTRANGDVFHKKSIHYGSLQRGATPRKPQKHLNTYYIGASDEENQRRRKERKAV